MPGTRLGSKKEDKSVIEAEKSDISVVDCTGPQLQQAAMADSTQVTLENVMKAIQDSNKTLQNIQLSMEKRFVSLEENLIERMNTTVKTGIDNLRHELSGEIDQVKTRLTEVEQKSHALINPVPCKQTVVIKNLACGQDVNEVRTKVNDLIKNGLNLQGVDIESAVKKDSPVEGREGIIIAKFKSEDDCRSALKKKSSLKDNQTFSNVFIEPDRTKEERVQIANLRSLAKAVGRDKVFVRGNRILARDHDKDRTGTADGMQRNQRGRGAPRRGGNSSRGGRGRGGNQQNMS